MSARAQNWVWEHANAKGVDLTVMLAVANLSHKNSHPYTSFASSAKVAKLCRITERYAIEVLDRLSAARQLSLEREGSGCRANLYDILPDLPLNPSSVLSLNPSSGVLQRKPKEMDVLQEETPSLVPFPATKAPTVYRKPRKAKA